MEFFYTTFVVLPTILAMEASAVDHFPRQPEGRPIHFNSDQTDVENSELLDQAPAGFLQQNSQGSLQISPTSYNPNLYSTGYAPDYQLPVNYQLLPVNNQLRPDISSPPALNRSTAMADSISSSQDHFGSIVSSDTATPKILHIPLVSGLKTHLIKLPLSGEAANVKLLHVSPPSALNLTGTSGIPHDVLKSLAIMHAGKNKIQPRGREYSQTDSFGSNRPISQKIDNRDVPQPTFNTWRDGNQATRYGDQHIRGENNRSQPYSTNYLPLTHFGVIPSQQGTNYKAAHVTADFVSGIGNDIAVNNGDESNFAHDNLYRYETLNDKRGKHSWQDFENQSKNNVQKNPNNQDFVAASGKTNPVKNNNWMYTKDIGIRKDLNPIKDGFTDLASQNVASKRPYANNDNSIIVSNNAKPNNDNNNLNNLASQNVSPTVDSKIGSTALHQEIPHHPYGYHVGSHHSFSPPTFRGGPDYFHFTHPENIQSTTTKQQNYQPQVNGKYSRLSSNTQYLHSIRRADNIAFNPIPQYHANIQPLSTGSPSDFLQNQNEVFKQPLDSDYDKSTSFVGDLHDDELHSSLQALTDSIITTVSTNAATENPISITEPSDTNESQASNKHTFKMTPNGIHGAPPNLHQTYPKNTFPTHRNKTKYQYYIHGRHYPNYFGDKQNTHSNEHADNVASTHNYVNRKNSQPQNTDSPNDFSQNLNEASIYPLSSGKDDNDYEPTDSESNCDKSNLADSGYIAASVGDSDQSLSTSTDNVHHQIDAKPNSSLQTTTDSSTFSVSTDNITESLVSLSESIKDETSVDLIDTEPISDEPLQKEESEEKSPNDLYTPAKSEETVKLPSLEGIHRAPSNLRHTSLLPENSQSANYHNHINWRHYLRNFDKRPHPYFNRYAKTSSSYGARAPYPSYFENNQSPPSLSSNSINKSSQDQIKALKALPSPEKEQNNFEPSYFLTGSKLNDFNNNPSYSTHISTTVDDSDQSTSPSINNLHNHTDDKSSYTLQTTTESNTTPVPTYDITGSPTSTTESSDDWLNNDAFEQQFKTSPKSGESLTDGNLYEHVYENQGSLSNPNEVKGTHQPAAYSQYARYPFRYRYYRRHHPISPIIEFPNYPDSSTSTGHRHIADSSTTPVPMSESSIELTHDSDSPALSTFELPTPDGIHGAPPNLHQAVPENTQSTNTNRLNYQQEWHYPRYFAKIHPYLNKIAYKLPANALPLPHQYPKIIQSQSTDVRSDSVLDQIVTTKFTLGSGKDENKFEASYSPISSESNALEINALDSSYVSAPVDEIIQSTTPSIDQLRDHIENESGSSLYTTTDSNITPDSTFEVTGTPISPNESSEDWLYNDDSENPIDTEPKLDESLADKSHNKQGDESLDSKLNPNEFRRTQQAVPYNLQKRNLFRYRHYTRPHPGTSTKESPDDPHSPGSSELPFMLPTAQGIHGAPPNLYPKPENDQSSDIDEQNYQHYIYDGHHPQHFYAGGYPYFNSLAYKVPANQDPPPPYFYNSKSIQPQFDNEPNNTLATDSSSPTISTDDITESPISPTDSSQVLFNDDSVTPINSEQKSDVSRTTEGSKVNFNLLKNLYQTAIKNNILKRFPFRYQTRPRPNSSTYDFPKVSQGYTALSPAIDKYTSPSQTKPSSDGISTPMSLVSQDNSNRFKEITDPITSKTADQTHMSTNSKHGPLRNYPKDRFRRKFRYYTRNKPTGTTDSDEVSTQISMINKEPRYDGRPSFSDEYATINQPHPNSSDESESTESDLKKSSPVLKKNPFRFSSFFSSWYNDNTINKYISFLTQSTDTIKAVSDDDNHKGLSDSRDSGWLDPFGMFKSSRKEIFSTPIQYPQKNVEENPTDAVSSSALNKVQDSEVHTLKNTGSKTTKSNDNSEYDISNKAEYDSLSESSVLTLFVKVIAFIEKLLGPNNENTE